MHISQQLKQIIERSGKSRYTISKDTGIAQSTLSRIFSGERGFSARAVDTLCDYFKLELRARK